MATGAKFEHGEPAEDLPMKSDQAASPNLSRQVVLFIGSIGPFGHLPASGTLTVAGIGIPLFYWSHGWPLAYRVLGLAVLTGLAIWIHQIGDRFLGEKDSRKLVWDEIVGYWFAVVLFPFTWQIALTAFLFERAFDIAKIEPAGWIERSWPGGLGVVGDDVVAGLYTFATIWLLVWLAPAWMGLTV